MRREISRARHVALTRARRQIDVVRVIRSATGAKAPQWSRRDIELGPCARVVDRDVARPERLTDAAAAESLQRLTAIRFAAELGDSERRDEIARQRRAVH